MTVQPNLQCTKAIPLFLTTGPVYSDYQLLFRLFQLLRIVVGHRCYDGVDFHHLGHVGN